MQITPVIAIHLAAALAAVAIGPICLLYTSDAADE